MVDMLRVLAIDENLLCMIASCFLIAACGVLTEWLLNDRTGALRDVLFGGIVLGGFLLAWLIYVMGNTGLPGGKDGETMDEYAYSEREHTQHHHVRKETFTAQVLVISQPRKRILSPDIAQPQMMSLESIARLIDSGRYRLELVAPLLPHDKPMLIVHEE